MRMLKLLLICPVLVLGLLSPVSPASAEPATVTTRYFENTLTFSNCTGDLLLLDQRVQFVEVTQGEKVRQNIIVTGTGTSLSDGSRYVLSSNRSYTAIGSDFVLKVRFRLINQGSGTDQFGVGYWNIATGEFINDTICR